MNRKERRTARRKGGLKKVRVAVDEINATAAKLGLPPLIEESGMGDLEGSTFKLRDGAAPHILEAIRQEKKARGLPDRPLPR
jgi:hypothetical protein